MTRLVCAHHFWFGVWFTVAGLLILGMLSNTYFLYHHVVEIGADGYLDWTNSQDFFYLFTGILILVNVLGLHQANERYHWVGLKSCSRKI